MFGINHPMGGRQGIGLKAHRDPSISIAHRYIVQLDLGRTRKALAQLRKAGRNRLEGHYATRWTDTGDKCLGVQTQISADIPDRIARAYLSLQGGAKTVFVAVTRY